MIIKINNLYKKFDRDYILNDVSLEVFPGETLTIIGPSGCGKSTLLKLIMGFIRPDSGSIYVSGKNIIDLSGVEMAPIRRKFGFVFQGAALFDSMTVFDNVAFGLQEAADYNTAVIKRVVMEKLEWVGLSHIVHQYPAALSGGMKKRVGIARALAFEPEILLYDEPTTGLDPLVSKNIEELIVRLKNDLHITSIVVTHQISTIFRVSDRIVFLNNGKLSNIGSIDKLREAKDDKQLYAFINAGII